MMMTWSTAILLLITLSGLEMCLTMSHAILYSDMKKNKLLSIWSGYDLNLFTECNYLCLSIVVF